MAYYERKFRSEGKTIYKKLEKYPTAELGRWKQNKKLDMEDYSVEKITYKSKPTKSKLGRVVSNYNVDYKNGNKMSVKLLSNSNKLPKKFKNYKNYNANSSKYIDKYYHNK